jgi:hypothetical protein
MHILQFSEMYKTVHENMKSKKHIKFYILIDWSIEI